MAAVMPGSLAVRVAEDTNERHRGTGEAGITRRTPPGFPMFTPMGALHVGRRDGLRNRLVPTHPHREERRQTPTARIRLKPLLPSPHPTGVEPTPAAELRDDTPQTTPS